MAEMNTIYDLKGDIIGIFRFGVAWKKETGERLGEYDDDFVYANDGTMLAKIGETGVVDTIGDSIGEFKGREFWVAGKKVGEFIGNKGAAAAAIVFLFSK
jgi:hypothetical protein